MVPRRANISAALVGLGLSIVTAQAACAQKLEIEILDAGIFEVQILKRKGTDDGQGHVVNALRRTRLVARTEIVPVRRCVTFGLRYEVRGRPADAQVSLRMVTRVPAPGLRNPRSGHIAREMETILPRKIGGRYTQVYTLEHAWELVPGVWRLEIWHGARRLAAQSFSLAGRCENGCESEDDHNSCSHDLISSIDH